MIDLRCHLFDGTACGAEDISKSLEICREAARDGVRTLVAVQGWEAAGAEPTAAAESFDACQRKLERLQAEAGGALDLKSGFIFRFHTALDETVAQYGSSVTLGGGRHVLVALPAVSTPAETERVWDALIKRGFSIIVAGPECSHDLRRNRARLESWIEMGVKLQLNAASITGAHGREVQRFAITCAKQYRGHVVVASNARRAGRTTLAQARETLMRQLGKRRAQALFYETPAAILETATDVRAEDVPRKPGVSSRLLQQIFRFRKAATDAP